MKKDALSSRKFIPAGLQILTKSCFIHPPPLRMSSPIVRDIVDLGLLEPLRFALGKEEERPFLPTGRNGSQDNEAMTI
jgi:hypothetical protein